MNIRSHRLRAIAWSILAAALLTEGPQHSGTGNAADAAQGKAAASHEGFVPIFNGKDLTGWDGDPRLWSVRNGVIRGETTTEKPAQGNTFLIWRGGKLRDFVLKLKFRIRDGNSGVQYRSQDLGKWSVSGYQVEVSNDRPNPGIGAGFLYHERGRGELAYVGEFAVIDSTGKRTVVGKVGDANALKQAGYYRNGDWNEFTITAHGNRLIHWVNGYQTAELIDNDPKGGAREGILALQIHAGPPMLVEFSDIQLKAIAGGLDSAGRKFNDKGQTGWVVAPDTQK
jgi:hypothetical protein